jgi:aspartyl-tRNA(Asn)/glutamyl-tRNA(Gln) amidotransferase subunit C
MPHASNMIARDEVLRIAALARLELSLEELERMTADLSKILEYVNQLSRVQGEARAADSGQGTPEREDRVVASRYTAELLDAASARDGALVKVPRVVE